MNKPIIVFTNFWDAEKLIQQKNFLSWNGESLYKIQLHDNPANYSISSIALAHPKLDKLPFIKSQNKNGYALPRLDFFCPTYEMLMDYKNGGSWEDYTNRYRPLLKGRKDDILSWFKSLIPNRVYVLCCWENTSNGSHCHRKLLFDAFTKSKALKDEAIYIYRDGSWNDNCKKTDFYTYVNETLISSQNNVNIPVTLGSEALSQQTGIPLGEQIGVGTTDANGAWAVTVNQTHQSVVESMFDEIGYSVGATYDDA